MKEQFGNALIDLIILVLIVVATIGYIWNIVKLFGAISDPVTVMLVLRCIGVVVAPLGIVVGYL